MEIIKNNHKYMTAYIVVEKLKNIPVDNIIYYVKIEAQTRQENLNSFEKLIQIRIVDRDGKLSKTGSRKKRNE